MSRSSVEVLDTVFTTVASLPPGSSSHCWLHVNTGAVYLHECPAGPAVPLYLLVSGVVTLLVMSQAVVPRLFPPEMLGKIWLCWVVCLGLFTLSWFIYGESQSHSRSCSFEEL